MSIDSAARGMAAYANSSTGIANAGGVVTKTNVASLTGLSSGSLSTSSSFALNGYSTRGDGGEGTFDYIPSSTATPDLGVVFAPNDLLTTVASESAGTGTGAQTTFTGTLAHAPIQPGTVAFTGGGFTTVDTGAGTFFATTSAGSVVNVFGWVNYTTGAYSITYASAPANANPITAAYSYATGAGRWVRRFNGTLNVQWWGATGLGPGHNDQYAIQMAINYANSAGGKAIFFPKPRVYYSLEGNYSPIPGFGKPLSLDNSQSLVFFPYVPQTGTCVLYYLQGEMDAISLPRSSAAAPTPGVVLYNNSPQSPPPATNPYPWMLSAGNGVTENNISVTCRGIIFRQPPATSTSNTVSGVNFGSACNYIFDGIVDVDAVFGTGAPATAPIPDPSLYRSCTGFQTSINNIATGSNSIERGAVLGYSVGYSLIGQGSHGAMYAAYCKTPVLCANEIHPKVIQYLNTNNCPNIFSFTAVSGQCLLVQCADLQGNNNPVWFQSTNCLSIANGLTAYGKIVSCLNNYSGPFMISSNGPSFIEIIGVDGGLLTPSLNNSATIPGSLVSGTIYRNTTGTTLKVSQPLTVNPTGGAAATYSWAVGSTNTPPTVDNASYPAASTTGIQVPATLMVPPGYYFSLTFANCTAGTLALSQGYN